MSIFRLTDAIVMTKLVSHAELSSAHKQTNISLQFDDDDNHANQGCSSETDTLNIFPNE